VRGSENKAENKGRYTVFEQDAPLAQEVLHLELESGNLCT
jgi:hypothetical protein